MPETTLQVPLHITVSLGAASLGMPTDGTTAAPSPAPGVSAPAATVRTAPATPTPDSGLAARLRAGGPELEAELSRRSGDEVLVAIATLAAAGPQEEGDPEPFFILPDDPDGKSLLPSWLDRLGQNAVTGLVRAVEVTSAEAAGRVVAAAVAAGHRVKAVGARCTDDTLGQPEQVLVQVGIVGELELGELHTKADPTGLVRVGAGTPLVVLAALLAGKDLALDGLPTFGEATLAGALATGSHAGGAVLADAVAAIDIVLADGAVHRFEPTKLSAGIPRARLHQGPQFYDAVVNLGALGVVVAVTLRARPAYVLHEERTVGCWSGTRAGLVGRLRSNPRIEVLLNPYATDGGPWRPQPQAWRDRTTVEIVRREADGPALTPVAGAPVDPLDHVAGSVGHTLTAAPGAIPWLLDQSLRAQAGGPLRAPATELPEGPLPFAAHRFEIAVPLAQLERAIDSVVDVLEHFADRPTPADRAFLTAPLRVRAVRGTPHRMAHTHAPDGALWAAIEIPRRTGTPNADAIVEEVKRRLARLGGRTHWGYASFLRLGDVESLPGQTGLRALVDRHDPKGTFGNRRLADLGLAGPLPTLEAAEYTPTVVNFSGEGHLSSTGKATSSEATLRRLFDALADRDAIVLHAHGGLVSERTGLATAGALGGFLAREAPVAAPVFLVWETGALEVLGPTLKDMLVGTRLGARLLRWAFRTVARELVPDLGDLFGLTGDGEESTSGAAGWVRAGESRDEAAIAALILPHVEADAATVGDLVWVARARAGTEGLESALIPDLRLSPAFLDEATGDVGTESVSSVLGFARVVARVALAVARRRAQPLGWNGGRQVLVEETLRVIGGGAFGQAIWSRMKLNAAAAYQPGRGGTLLMDLLAGWLAARPARRLHLVGHSAGSFHVGAWLRELSARLPGRERIADTVVLWAPACDQAFFAATLAPALPRVGTVRMFGLDEAVEEADRMVPHVYDSSLLCLVSGLLEARPGWPILGMARFFDRAEGTDADTARRCLAETCVRTPTAAGAPEGLRSGATSHGGFNTEPATQASLAHAICLA